jgi:pilus assembly protein Flp/PilA
MRGSTWSRPVSAGQSGQGMVEYAVVLVLVAVVVLLILGVVGKQTNNVFSNIGHGLSQ